MFNAQPLFSKHLDQTQFIHTLEQPGTKFTMDFDRCTNDVRTKLLVGHASNAFAPQRPQAALFFAASAPLSSAVSPLYFISANFPFSMLITAISLGSTPFFSAQ